MAERLSNPVGVISGCGVWLPIAFWTVSLIGWMIQGDVDPISGICGIAAGLVLGYFAMMPPIPELGPVFFVAALSVVVLFPFLRSSLTSRALAQIDIETIAKCYQMLREKPGNVGAQLRLARTLYIRGLRGQAVSIATEAIKGLPRVGYEEEVRQVKQWKAATRPDDYRPIVCVECGHSNDPEVVFCSKCRSSYLLDYVKGRWIGRRQAKRLIVTWTAIVGSLIGVPGFVGYLPPTAGIIGAFGVLVASLTAVLYVFRAGDTAEA